MSRNVTLFGTHATICTTTVMQFTLLNTDTCRYECPHHDATCMSQKTHISTADVGSFVERSASFACKLVVASLLFL